MEHIKTDDTVYFTANFYHPVSGNSIDADFTPRYLVYEDSTASSILEGDMSVRSDFSGSYYGSFIASEANGFDSNSFYDVQVSGAVNDRHAIASVKQFVLDDVFDSNIVQVSGENISLANTDINANVTQVSGVEADIDSFKADLSTLNNLSTSDVNTEVDTALSDYDVATRVDLLAVSGSTLDANLVQVNGSSFELASELNANVTQVSGEPVDIDSFKADVSNLDQDIYFANIKYIRDNVNSQDEYSVQWFKNDQPVSSGNLTDPKLSVYNTSDGSVLVDNVDMNYASPNIGVVRYNESSSLMTSGEPYLVETSGTIDTTMKTWKYIVGIDKL